MKKRKIRLIAWLVVFVFTSMLLTSCRGDKGNSGNTTGKGTKFNEIANTVANIDDIPNWTGKQLNLVAWLCHGTNNQFKGKTATKDVFKDELARVTGIKFDAENSFDNNGESGDARIAKIIASNSWPDIGWAVPNSIIEKLVKADKIYDLTDALEKYAPNYTKFINSNENIKASFDTLKINNKVYKISSPTVNAIKFFDPNYTVEEYIKVLQPEDTRGWFWIRDDILKRIYPNAKSQKEIQGLYVQNGKFTEDDMKDVTIKSPQEFKELLKKIKALGIKEGNREVWPFYTHRGTDNWDLLTMFNALWGAPAAGVNYFSYYDVEEKKILPTVKQKWYKDTVRFYADLVNEGLASKEALVDNSGVFEQKKNNGEYAIIYGNTLPPTDVVLKTAGKNYSYRKVMLDIPVNTKKFVKKNRDSDLFLNAPLIIFKNQIKPDNLEQVVRFIDFFYSKAGMKYVHWGSKKSGLFKEENGKMTFTDEKYAVDKFYDAGNKTNIYYGFDSWVPLGIFNHQANTFIPKRATYSSTQQRKASDWMYYWNYGIIEKPVEYPMILKGWMVYEWDYEIEGLKKFYQSRQVFEDNLKMVFASKNQNEFEAAYQKLISDAEKKGYTDETFKELNEKFEKTNGDYAKKLKEWRP